jgi:hypothetical protein
MIDAKKAYDKTISTLNRTYDVTYLSTVERSVVKSVERGIFSASVELKSMEEALGISKTLNYLGYLTYIDSRKMKQGIYILVIKWNRKKDDKKGE